MKTLYNVVIFIVLVLVALNVAVTGAKVSDLHTAMFAEVDEEVEGLIIDPNITTAATADEVFAEYDTVVTE